MSDPTNEQAARRLEALRARGQVFDREYEALRRELEGYARSISGARADQAEFQPESIVANALSKAMAPALEQVAKEMAGKVKVVKLDVDQSPRVTGQYAIQAMPTLIMFKGGKPVGRQTGALVQKVKLEAWIKDQFKTA